MRKTIFFLKRMFFKTYKNKMSHTEILTQLSLWIVNLYLKSCIFCLHFNLYLHVWIWIRIRTGNTDPESSWIQIQYGSGSTTLLLTKTLHKSDLNPNVIFMNYYGKKKKFLERKFVCGTKKNIYFFLQPTEA